MRLPSNQRVERAADRAAAHLEDVRVDHGRCHVGMRHLHTCLCGRDIARPDAMGVRQLRTKLHLQRLRQHHDAVLAALARADHQGLVREIQILDPQLQGFRDLQAGATQQLCQQGMFPRQL